MTSRDTPPQAGTLPSICQRLNKLSHTFAFDSEHARTCADAALTIQKQAKALRTLRDYAATRPVLNGDGVKAVREAGKFMAALEQAQAVLTELEGK